MLKNKRTYNRIGLLFHFNLICRSVLKIGVREVEVTIKMGMN